MDQNITEGWEAAYLMAEVWLVKGSDTQAGEAEELLVFVQIWNVRNVNLSHCVAV